MHEILIIFSPDRVTKVSSRCSFVIKKINIANATSVGGYERGLTLMVYKFFDKKTEGYGVKIKSVGVNNQQLANELHKTIRRKFKTKKSNFNFDR